MFAQTVQDLKCDVPTVESSFIELVLPTLLEREMISESQRSSQNKFQLSHWHFLLQNFQNDLSWIGMVDIDYIFVSIIFAFRWWACEKGEGRIRSGRVDRPPIALSPASHQQNLNIVQVTTIYGSLVQFNWSSSIDYIPPNLLQRLKTKLLKILFSAPTNNLNYKLF